MITDVNSSASLPVRRPSAARRLRLVQRGIHLAAAVLAAVAVYAAPLVPADTARAVLAWVVFPVLTLSGVGMWKQAALRRVLTRRTAAASAPAR